MEKDNLSSLYNALISKGYSTDDLGDENTFRSKMSNKNNRKDLYDYVSERGDFRIGDYDSYENRLAGDMEGNISKAGPKAQEVVDEYDAIRHANAQDNYAINRMQDLMREQDNKPKLRKTLQDIVSESSVPIEKNILNREISKESAYSSKSEERNYRPDVFDRMKYDSSIRDEDASIDKEYTPKVEEKEEDVFENYRNRFGLTQRGTELQKELAQIQSDLQDKYFKEFENTPEYKAIVEKKYNTKKDIDAANKALNDAYNKRYGAVINKEMKPYLKAYEGEIFQRYAPRIQEGLRTVAKNDTSQKVKDLTGEVDDLLEKQHKILRSKGASSGNAMSALMGSATYNQSTVKERQELGALEASQRLLEQSQEIIEEAGKKGNTNFFAGLGRGFRDNMDIENFTFGLSEMIDSKYLNRALEKAEKGEKLTPAEEKLLEASAINMATYGYFSSDLGRGYGAGSTTAVSLPFMMEFIANPISGSGNAIAKGLLKFGLKKFGKASAQTAGKGTLNAFGRSIKSNAGKFAGRLVGDAAAALGMEGTTGLGRVAAGTLDRLNENFKYGFDENGNLQVEKVDNTSLGKALARSVTSNFIENQSEMIFNAFKGWSPFMKAADKSIPGGLPEFIQHIKNSKVGNLYRNIKNNPTFREAARRSQFHGLGEEYLEEVYNNFANVATGEMSIEDAISFDNNIDTFLGLAPTSVAFTALGLGGLAHERIDTQRKLNRILQNADDKQRMLFKEIDIFSKEQNNIALRRTIRNILSNSSITPEMKRDAIQYAYERRKADAINDIQQEQVKEQNIQQETAQESGASIYETHNPQEMRSTVLRQQISRQRLSQTGMSDEDIQRLEQADNQARAQMLDAMEADTRRIASDYLIQSDALSSMESELDRAHAPEVEEARVKISQMNPLGGNITLIPLDSHADETHQYGVILNGLNPGGTIPANAPLIVAPIESLNGQPSLSTFGQTANVSFIPRPASQPTIIPQDEALTSMLGDYQADADILDGTPITLGATFPIMSDDGTMGNITVTGQDPATGQWLITDEEGKQQVPISDEELRIRKEEAEKFPILEEYRKSDEEYINSRVPIETLGKKRIPNGLIIVPTGFSGDEIAYDLVREDGRIIDSGNMTMQEFNELDPYEEQPIERSEENAPQPVSGKTEITESGRYSTESVQPSQDVKQLSPIVMKEDGTPDFVATGEVNSLSYLNDKYKEKALRKIEVTKAAYAKDLEKASVVLEKAQTTFDDAPIGREAKAEEALKKAKQAYDNVKRESDFWTSLYEIAKIDAEQPGDKIAEEIRAMGEPMDGRELAAEMLASGRLPLLYSDYKRETGFGENEAKSLFGLFKSKDNGGLSIKKAGEVLMLADQEVGSNFFDPDDANAGRNAILDVLSSVRTRGGLIDYIKNNREAMAEREKAAEQEYEEEKREAWAQEHFGMSYADYITYEEVINDIIQEKALSKEAIQEFYNNFAEELNNWNNERITEETTVNERGAVDSRSESSKRLLSTEQLSDNRGTKTDIFSEADGRTDNKGVPASEESIITKIEDAREQVDTNPSDAQKEAGNYKKGHIKLDGYDITIENPKDSKRSGTDRDGNSWSITMNNDYGYIRGTESVDGDHIDVFLSDNPVDGKVYVIDQVNEDGSFDEHKIMYGFNSTDEARGAYLSNYSPGWKGLGAISEVSKDEFKKWIDSSHRKTKPFVEYKNVKIESTQSENQDNITSKSTLPQENSGDIADTRYRFIGEQGATNLDKAEEATIRMDNLNVARDMEAAFNEKKERIEKLRKSVPVEITGKEVIPSNDLKQYKKNALSVGKALQGEYINSDTGNVIQLQRGRKNGGVNEILQHDYKNEEHLQSIAAIPQIIEKSIYIASEDNTDIVKNPNVNEYQYYVCGLKIGDVDYTVRATVAVDKDRNRYYDHKLTHIEKGTLVDNLNGLSNSVAANQSSSFMGGFGTTPGTKPTTANLSYVKDKKLLSILQTNEKENAKKIKMVTGWERGADGKWRYEEDNNQKQIIQSVEDLSGKLNTPVRIARTLDEVSNDSAKRAIEEGIKVKGWFDNGEVVIYLPNAESVDDAMTTVLHEVIGHKGLRELLVGENVTGAEERRKAFDDAMLGLYKQLPADVQETVEASAKKNYDGNISIAMDEYLAEQAEKNEPPSWWDKVVSAIRNLLRKLGIEVNLSANDIKYLLWKSQRNLRSSDNPIDVAKETVMRSKLEIGKHSNETNVMESDVTSFDNQVTAETLSRQKMRFRIADNSDREIAALNSRVSSLEKKISKLEDREELRRSVTDFIRKEVSSDLMGYLDKQDLNSLLMQAQNAKSNKSLEKIVMNVKNVMLNAQRRRLQRIMDRLLSLKVQDVNGKNMSIAKNVDDSTRKIFSFLRGKVSNLALSGFEDEMKYIRREIRDKQQEISRLKNVLDTTKKEDEKQQLSKQITSLSAETEELKTKLNTVSEEAEVVKEQILNQGDIDVDAEMKRLREKLEDAAVGNDMWTQGDTERMVALNILSSIITNKKHDGEIESIEIDKQKLLLSNSDLFRKRIGKNETERKRLTNQINENYRRIVAYDRLVNDIRSMQVKQMEMTIEQLNELVSDGKNSLMRKTEEENKRKRELVSKAIRSVEGKPIDIFKDNQSKENWAKKFFSAPLGSFEYMCRRINTKTLGKDGFFYKRFIEGNEGVLEAYDTYVKGMKEFRTQLDNMCKEIFGKRFEKISSLSDKPIEKSGVYITQSENEQAKGYGVRYELPLTKGQAMYIYQVWKMNDGRTKLELQGFDEESISQIVDFMGPEYVKFANWVQDDFLKEMRDKYNAKYLTMYNTSLAEIENYIPLKIRKEAIRQESALSEGRKERKKLEEKAGSLINRTVNTKPVDITRSGFDVLLEHGNQMEEWNAYARVRKDLDYILSSTRFRNQLNTNTRGSYENFYDAAEVATKSNHPDSAKFGDMILGKLSKGIVGGNIAFRLNTALKQVLSAPAFFGYSQSPAYMWQLSKAMITPYKNFKWCMENMPSFYERVNSGTIGNEKLDEKGFSRLMDKYIEVGMIPNKLVDAITCSLGAKSIYEYKSAQLKKAEVPKEEAHQQALKEADIYYNATQQSSHPAFLSPMQMSRTLTDRMLTTYQNSNIGYVRRLMGAFYDLTRSFKWKELKANYIKMYMEEGLSEQEAESKAYKRLLNENRKNVVEIALFGWGLNLLWNIGSQGLLGFFRGDGDDDDKKWTKDLAFLLTSPMKGLPGGNLLESMASGYGMDPFLVYEELDKFMKELNKTIDDYGLISPEIAYITLAKASRYAAVDLEVWGNIYLGIEGMTKDGALNDDKLIDIMYMLNSPKSSREEVAKELYKDEPALEYAKKITRAMKYIPKENGAEIWVPGVKPLTKRKEQEIKKEAKILQMTPDEKRKYDNKKLLKKHLRKMKSLKEDQEALQRYKEKHKEELEELKKEILETGQ